MSLELLEHTSEAYSDSEWKPRESSQRRAFNRYAQAPASFLSRRLHVKFGRGVSLEFGEPPSRLMPAIERIVSVGSLQSNWDSYRAMPVDPLCAAAAITFVLNNVNDQMPLPSAVPTSRGGVQLEWHCKGVDVEIEFSSPSRTRFAFEDCRTGETEEQVLFGDFRPLARILQRLSH